MSTFSHLCYSIAVLLLLVFFLHYLQGMEKHEQKITITIHETHDGFTAKATHPEGKPILCQVCQRAASVFICCNGRESYYCSDHKPAHRYLIY